MHRSLISLAILALVSLASTASAQHGHYDNGNYNNGNYNNTTKWELGMTASLQRTQNGVGLLVQQAAPYGPAAQSGLRPGFLITSVDGIRLDTVHSTFEAYELLQRSVRIVSQSHGFQYGSLTVHVTKPCGMCIQICLHLKRCLPPPTICPPVHPPVHPPVFPPTPPVYPPAPPVYPPTCKTPTWPPVTPPTCESSRYPQHGSQRF